MKLKIIFHGVIAGILFTGILTSCNTGNKVVSSFGKRKYTKGYYLNLGFHKKPETPVIAGNKVSIAMHKTSSGERAFSNQARKTTGKNMARPINSISQVTSNLIRKKANEIRLPKNITSSNANKSLEETKSSSFPVSPDYGVPGHGSTVYTGDNRADKQATTGFILGILSFLVFPPLAILGLIFSISGLKSEKNHTFAVIGEVLSIIVIAAIVIVVVVLILAPP